MDQVQNEEIFQYIPLESPRHIRVIRVYRSKDPTDLIRIKFHTTNIDNPCDYQTLSYTWGETHADGSHLSNCVFCEGRLLRISQKLYEFLQDFRSRPQGFRVYSNLPIWIDALSINQDDPLERGQQVAMMSRIYSRGFQLNIWLGDIVFAGTAEIPSASSTASNGWPESTRLWDFLPQIFQHPWFSRRWVVQEVISSRRLVRVVWTHAPELLEWEVITESVRKSRLPPSVLPPILKSRGVIERPRSTTLLGNLRDFHFTKCGDGRDLVYALLSISVDANEFEIDYSSDAETVYHQVGIKTACRTEGKEELIPLLVSAIVRTDLTSPPTLPSWVPDWRNPIRALTSSEEDCVNTVANTYASRRVIGEREELLCVTGWTFPACRCLIRSSGAACETCCENHHIGHLHASHRRKDIFEFVKMLPSCLCSSCVLLFDRTADICGNDDRRARSLSSTIDGAASRGKRNDQLIPSHPPPILNGQVLFVLKESSDIAFILSQSSGSQTTRGLRYQLTSCLRLARFWPYTSYLEEHVQAAQEIVLE